MAWIRLDSNIHTNPRMMKAGPFAPPVFIALLCIVKEHGKGGRIDAETVDAETIASTMGIVAGRDDRDDVFKWINAALTGLLRAGLIDEDGDDLFIVGWSKYQRDQTAAERQRRSRANKEPGVTDVTRDARDVTQSRHTGRDGTRQYGTGSARDGVYKVALAKAREELAKNPAKYVGMPEDRYLAALDRVAKNFNVSADDLRASA